MKKADAFFMEAPPLFFLNQKGKQNEALAPPMTFKFLLPALTACLLTACGGSDDDGMGNPADRPSASEQQAFEKSKVKVAPMNWGGTPDPFHLQVDGSVLEAADAKTARIDARRLPSGFATLSGNYIFLNHNNYRLPATVRSYQGFRSGIFIAHSDQPGVFAHGGDYGVWSKAEQLPSSGRATYRGVAFDRANEGTLTYHVDFAARTGEGQIDGLPRYDGTITLRKAGFQTHSDGAIGVKGGAADTRYKGSLTYQTGFAGAGAEELTGHVVNAADKEIVGFHGTRGEISQ